MIRHTGEVTYPKTIHLSDSPILHLGRMLVARMFQPMELLARLSLLALPRAFSLIQIQRLALSTPLPSRYPMAAPTPISANWETSSTPSNGHPPRRRAPLTTLTATSTRIQAPPGPKIICTGEARLSESAGPNILYLLLQISLTQELLFQTWASPLQHY